VRLFKELQARNAEVTEALEQQTATAEILSVISKSPTDTQPVFNAIVSSGARLFRGLNVSVLLVKGDQVDLAASTLPEPVGKMANAVSVFTRPSTTWAMEPSPPATNTASQPSLTARRACVVASPGPCVWSTPMICHPCPSKKAVVWRSSSLRARCPATGLWEIRAFMATRYTRRY
jgi:hypothetical protein